MEKILNTIGYKTKQSIKPAKASLLFLYFVIFIFNHIQSNLIQALASDQ